MTPTTYQQARFCSEETSVSLTGVSWSLRSLWPLGLGLKSSDRESSGLGILWLCQWPWGWRGKHSGLCNTFQIIKDINSRDWLQPELESLLSFSHYGFSLGYSLTSGQLPCPRGRLFCPCWEGEGHTRQMLCLCCGSHDWGLSWDRAEGVWLRETLVIGSQMWVRSGAISPQALLSVLQQ